ncbi:hypothetical protein OIU34_24015 [Pararhizobium sp. BT-229]|uniref:hypothetical protein n=1 Tax=Pararhizobium sp. BT-229 TaxID=2986923 RepID=UPI0021F7A048|nr:hypothetical protein [Pararhizobium sp. BT-229]MCV9964965.1 hypothetical protein [Pararhizobium sp. BT-229]
MTISCQIPMSYVIKGIAGGRKGVRSYLFGETSTIEIDEVGTEDAPVAVSWRVPGVPADTRFDYFNHVEARTSDASGRNHTVFYRDRHWLRLLHGFVAGAKRGHEWETSEGITLGEFLSFVDLGRYNALFGLSPIWDFMKLEAVGGDPSLMFERVAESERPRSVRSLARLELLSVDGIVYVAGDQPSYALPCADKHMTRFRYPYVTAMKGVLADNPRIDETSFLPFSMRDELERRKAEAPDDVVFPDLDVEVHLAQSISRDEDLRVGADYHVRVLMDARKRARSRQYPELAPYFGMTDIEEKADFIASVRSRWPAHSGGLSPAPLDAALSLLDERSISLPVRGGPSIPAA